MSSLLLGEDFLDGGGDGSAFGSSGQCGGGGFHDAPHVFETGGACLLNQSANLGLEGFGREWLRQVAFESSDLCQLGFGQVWTTLLGIDAGGLAALLDELLEDTESGLIGEGVVRTGGGFGFEEAFLGVTERLEFDLVFGQHGGFDIAADLIE